VATGKDPSLWPPKEGARIGTPIHSMGTRQEKEILPEYKRPPKTSAIGGKQRRTVKTDEEQPFGCCARQKL